MNPPEGQRSEFGENVDLTWNAMTAPRNGGSDIVTYILQFASTASLEADEWTYLLGNPDDETTWTNDAMMDSEGVYGYQHANAETEKLHYKIAARNAWGTGVFSKPNLEIDVAQEPDQITDIIINDSGRIVITWVDP